MAEVSFTEDAIDDLRRIGPSAVPRVLRKILMLVDAPEAGYPLGGDLTGYRKLVVGRNTWRVVYRVINGTAVEICEVWAVGARADAEVYAEAVARVRAAGTSSSYLRRLADVIELLGRLTGDVAVVEDKPREPVPDWLAERLIQTASVRREDVASLDLQEAVDMWTAFVAENR